METWSLDALLWYIAILALMALIGLVLVVLTKGLSFFGILPLAGLIYAIFATATAETWPLCLFLCIGAVIGIFA